MTKQTLTKNKPKTDNVVYLYDKLQISLVETLYELYYYARSNHSETISENIDIIESKMEVSERLTKRIFPQLVWWIIFQEPVNGNGSTIFERYMKLNQIKWRKKSTAFHETLSSWQSISPGFYMTKSVGKSERVGTLVNIVGLKQYTVAVYNKVFEPLQRGELLTGFLLPIGDGIYTSPIDLFHIPVDDTPKVTWEVLLHFHQHTNSSEEPPPPQLYLSLIKSALEGMEENYQ